MKKYLLVGLFLVAACGKNSDSPAIKSIFSKWQETGCTNGGVEDLSQGNFTSNFISTYTYKSGEVCTCTARIQSGLNYAFTGCSYVPSTGLGSDPGCAVHHNDNGGYTIDASSVLRLQTQILPVGDSICLIFN